MSFHAYVEVKASSFGKGLFATKPFISNEIICIATGRLITFKETLLLGDKESHSLQIDKDKYILCEAPFLYTNHSCNPNCALNENLQLFALKTIHEGDELFWDYSTSMFERHWTMKCYCGSKHCRKIIQDFDLMPEDVQTRYLQMKIVLPFIIEEFISKNKSIQRV